MSESRHGDHWGKRVSSKPSNAAERAGQAIVQLRRNPYGRAIQRKLYSVGEYELTPVQVDILEAVVATPGSRMNELAQALGVSASTLSRTIVPLVELGLVERRRGDQDKRLTRLSPTKAGLKQARTIHQSRQRMARAVQDHFSPERLALFADLFEEYIAAIAIEGRILLGETAPPEEGEAIPDRRKK